MIAETMLELFIFGSFYNYGFLELIPDIQY